MNDDDGLREALLALYDDQLRAAAETPGAVAVVEHGPLRLASFTAGRGFVTYRDLGGADADGVRALVAAAVEHFAADAAIERFEWKTRGHDHAPGLHEALLAHGLTAGDEETVMLGEAAGAAGPVDPPDGVTLRQVHEHADVEAMEAMLEVAFGWPSGQRATQELMDRLARDDGMELWVAEAADGMVGAGRLEPVADGDVAGIWGGGVLPAWRGRGVYRAITAARAASALRIGTRYLHSDSTPMSRPILERLGLVAVTTTTPYTWVRARA